MALSTLGSNAVADDAVTSAKIADDAVTGAKIENSPTIAGNLTVSGSTSLAAVTATGTTTGFASEDKLALNGTDGSATDAGDFLVLNSTDGSANDGENILYEDATGDVNEVLNSSDVSIGTNLTLSAKPKFNLAPEGAGMDLLLDSEITSAVASFEVGSSVINEKYDTYFVTMSMMPASDGVYLYTRGFVNRAEIGAAGNHYGNEKASLSSSTYTNANDSQIWCEYQISAVGNASGEGQSFHGYIQNVNSSTRPCCISGICENASTGGLHNAQVTAGKFDEGNAGDILTGFNFYYNSGNIASGHVRVYGLRGTSI